MKLLTLCLILTLLQEQSTGLLITDSFTECSLPLVHTAKRGKVYSHAGYLNQHPYQPDLYCEYEIKADEGEEIIIKIDSIDLEESNDCIFDYLEIGYKDSDKQQYFCGNEPPDYPLVIHNASAGIVFSSDSGSGGYKGFVLSYYKRPITKSALLKSENQNVNTAGCGLAPPLIDFSLARIINGSAIGDGQWPWMVSLWYRDVFMCGSSLISDRWLLTAAHCFPRRLNPKNWKAVVGEHALEWLDEGEFSVDIDEIHVHPEYGKTRSYDNDFTLVKLKQPVEFDGDLLGPVCLPDKAHFGELDLRRVKEDSQFNAECYAAGWGRTESESKANILHHLKVDLINVNTCNQTKAYKGRLTSSMLCAGLLEGGQDTCKGDSGGPLMCRLADDKSWYQIGIISHGKSCADKEAPGLYSNVVTALDWINSIVEGD